ncbi:MAG: hypothetical protein ACI97B_001136 [Verrucomicrobiales bacterium]|jgi:hypothetical protein
MRRLLYLGLFDADTGERLREAFGAKGPQMRRVVWNVNNLTGRKVKLRLVDQKTSNWGHLTFDDFSVDGTLLER